MDRHITGRSSAGGNPAPGGETFASQGCALKPSGAPPPDSGSRLLRRLSRQYQDRPRSDQAAYQRADKYFLHMLIRDRVFITELDNVVHFNLPRQGRDNYVSGFKKALIVNISQH
jgi:hypothetical protein